MNTANTILEQIKAIDPGALWAWGSKNFVGAKETHEHYGFLEFDATNNPKIKKCKIRITLEYNDTYTVKAYSTRKVPGKLEYKETVYNEYKDVHFPDLVDFIDSILG